MNGSRCDKVSSGASLLGEFCHRKGSSRRLGTLLAGDWITDMTVSPQSHVLGPAASGIRREPFDGDWCRLCRLLPIPVPTLSRPGVFAEAASLI